MAGLIVTIVDNRISGWCIVIIPMHSAKNIDLCISYQHKYMAQGEPQCMLILLLGSTVSSYIKLLI